MKKVGWLVIISVLIAGCAGLIDQAEPEQEEVADQAEGNQEDSPTVEEAMRKFELTSSAFDQGAQIPVKYSCDGEDIAPELTWNEPPVGTKSFVLIMDDPDAPVGTWVHWVVYNLSPETRSLPEGGELPTGALHGENSWARQDYGGPCPPGGTHRYFFKLYALDSVLDLPAGESKKSIELAMEGHILIQAELMGVFSR
jgi:Raf kinase inhibitor-like YbhB/YbcL family protein